MRISVLLKVGNTEFFANPKNPMRKLFETKTYINKMELNVGFRTESDFAAAASDARLDASPAAGTSPLQAQLPLFS